MDDRQPEVWTRLLPLLDAALEASPEDPAAWLEAHPPEDPELLALARDVLRRGTREDELLGRSPEEVALEALRDLDRGPREGTRLGPYLLGDEIARGGMGVVHRARRIEAGFDDEVVIKFLPPALDTPDRRARFLLERQLLASLRHPNVAQLLDGGITETGQPFLVLEYVEGDPIDAAAERDGLDLRARIRVFLSVLDAVAHAHRNLVVHRDLKPSNVLVDRDGHVKLLDFGIAKVLHEDPGAGLTRTGLPLLTPEFASPEQVRGETITTAVDVYQLGLVLFLLLTGVQPQSGAGDSIAALERTVCRDEPPLASRVCQRPWRRRLRGDLDRVLLRALAKDPARRYASADAFAEDLRRHLDGQPILARGDSWAYRAAKLVARHPAWSAAALVGVAAVSLFAGFDSVRVRAERDRAQLEARQREEITDLLVDLFDASGETRAHAEEITARELLERGVQRIRDELEDQPELRASMLGVIGRATMKIGLFERALPLFEEALAETSELHGEESEEVLAALVDLARVRQARREFDESRELWERVLASERPDRRLDARTRISALHGIGVADREQERLESAESRLVSAFDLARVTTPVDSSTILMIEVDLAALARRQGRDAEAEALYRQVLSVARGDLERSAVDLPQVLNNLAFLLRKQGRYDEAIDLYREGIERLDERAGPGHPTTIMVRDNLASALDSQGRADELESVLRETLRRTREFQAVENWRVASAEQNLARIVRDRGDHAAALRGYATAEAILRRELGEDHAWTVCAAMDRVVTRELARGAPLGSAVDSIGAVLARPVGSAGAYVTRRLGVAGESAARHGREDLRDRIERWVASLREG